jgi:hypothetical protein
MVLLLCQYLSKIFFKIFISGMQSYQGFRGFAIFVEKIFLGIFLFFLRTFASASKGPEKGPEELPERGSEYQERTGRKNYYGPQQAGKTHKTAPEERTRKEGRRKTGIQPQQRGEKRQTNRGNVVCREVCGSCQVSRRRLSGDCQPCAMRRFTLQGRVSGSVKGKSFTNVLSTYTLQKVYNIDSANRQPMNGE